MFARNFQFAIFSFQFAILLCGIAQARADQPPAEVLAAESQRIGVMAKASSSVLAIFDPAGQGGGSGVVISADGFAITNFHVTHGCGNAMKCGMLIAVPIHACTPAPMKSRSERPLSRSGTKTITESPPTHRKSTIGERMDGGGEGGVRSGVTATACYD